jgi:hypothetical protein
MKLFKFKKKKPNFLEIDKEVDKFEFFPRYIDEWNKEKIKFATKTILTFGKNWNESITGVNEFIKDKNLDILIVLLADLFRTPNLAKVKKGFGYYTYLDQFFKSETHNPNILYGFAINGYLITGKLPLLENYIDEDTKNFLSKTIEIHIRFKTFGKINEITYLSYIYLLHEYNLPIENIITPISSLFLINDNSENVIKVSTIGDLKMILQQELISKFKESTIVNLPIEINRFVLNKDYDGTPQ